MNEKIAKIFGYVLGDGWVDIHCGCGISGDILGLKVLSNDIDAIYGKGTSRKIVSRKTYSPKYGIAGTTNSFITSKSFSRAMIALGMPKGKKAEQDYDIPNWILQGSIEIKRAFLSGYYAAEGSIPSLQKKRLSKIRF